MDAHVTKSKIKTVAQARAMQGRKRRGGGDKPPPKRQPSSNAGRSGIQFSDEDEEDDDMSIDEEFVENRSANVGGGR